MADAIDIPLVGTDKVVEISLDKLPMYEEVISILKCEHSDLHIWINLALEYYKSGDSKALVDLLESSHKWANINYKNSDEDQMQALDMLAAYYVQIGNREKDTDKRRTFFSKASHLYTMADKIIMYETNHLLGRAFLCLLSGDNIDQAENQFDLILNRSLNNIPAKIGKANIALRKRDYEAALMLYKEILRYNPKCPADIRLGMAYCFYELGNVEKAKAAFDRTLELDHKCVAAFVGLAIMKLNSENTANIKLGVHILSKAYNIDETNPMVLNHLANHFFFKKDFPKCELLAKRALQNTNNDHIRAESFYQLGRIYHAQNSYDQAFHYYYQATQFASIKFVLPHFGLGQMYIKGNEIEKAIQCFEKILKAFPDNYESMKILGSLYAASTNKQKQNLAKLYLKKVTENCPEDSEAWIELAQLLEHADVKGSLSAYTKAMDLMKKNGNSDIPPEILNNIAALHYMTGNLNECRSKLEESLITSKKMFEIDQQRFSSTTVTATYNLARIYEVLCQFQKAEEFYKDIIKEHPTYIDCYFRLGCMARDRNQIYEASDWFKEVLRIDNNNADAWSFLGNLHLAKLEWGSSQKKFERVLRNPSTLNDPYSLIAIGNIWLQSLHRPLKSKALEIKHQNLALKFFTKVLKEDPTNIWAANGIGCVLAHKNYITEAKEVFNQVRESTANFCDVWLNIAHIYVEQQQYINAIQMYKNCIQQFYKHDDIEVLQYLGRAYWKAGKLKESKAVFLKSRLVAPQDITVLYNLAFVLQKFAIQVFKDSKSKLKEILLAVNDIELSQKYFQYLTVVGDNNMYDVSLAYFEAKRSQDILDQSKLYVVRARQMDNDEREMKLKKEKELEELRLRKIKSMAKALKQKEDERKQMLFKREEYKKKTKDTLLFVKNNVAANSHQNKKEYKQFENFGSNSSENSVSSDLNKSNKSVRMSKFKHKRESRAGNNIPKQKKECLSSSNMKSSSLSHKQKKVVSKKTVSTSEDNISNGEIKKKTFVQLGYHKSKRSSDHSTSGSFSYNSDHSESSSSDKHSELNRQSSSSSNPDCKWFYKAKVKSSQTGSMSGSRRSMSTRSGIPNSGSGYKSDQSTI